MLNPNPTFDLTLTRTLTRTLTSKALPLQPYTESLPPTPNPHPYPYPYTHLLLTYPYPYPYPCRWVTSSSRLMAIPSYDLATPRSHLGSRVQESSTLPSGAATSLATRSLKSMQGLLQSMQGP